MTANEINVFSNYYPSSSNLLLNDDDVLKKLKLELSDLENEYLVYSRWITNNKMLAKTDFIEKCEILKFDIGELFCKKNSLDDEYRVALDDKCKLSDFQKSLVQFYFSYDELSNKLSNILNTRTYVINIEKDVYYSYSRKIDSAVQQIEKLSKINVFHDLFSIYIDKNVGYINNIMIGVTNETPNFNVINRGLGEIVLLLYVLEKLIKHNFKYYKLNPMGSVSTLYDKKTKRMLTVFKEGFFNWRHNLNQSIKGVLVCMKEIDLYLGKMGQGKKIPYSINLKKYAIGKKEWYSVEFPSSKDDYIWWNKAFKCILSNLKMYMILVA